MKWLADYQMVRGINLFVFGYYALSNAGQWMLLFEPHSGPVTPWWDFMGPYFRYIARTSSLMASGRPVADIVVYYDDCAFMLGGAEAAVAGNMHYAVAKSLDRLNCEYDFAEDAALVSRVQRLAASVLEGLQDGGQDDAAVCLDKVQVAHVVPSFLCMVMS